MSRADHLVAPHGGALKTLVATSERSEELRSASREWPSWDLTPRQLCDLELLMNGGFSPLEGFMTRRDYEPVRDAMRLSDGTLWPVPIALDVPEAVARGLQPGATLALRDAEGVMLAAPEDADVVLDTADFTPEEAAQEVILHLVREGYVKD